MKRRITLIDHIKSMTIRYKIIVFYLTLVVISISISAFLYVRISNSYLDRTLYELSMNEVQNHNRSLEILIEDINTYSKEIISSPSIQTALDPNQKQIYQLKKVDQEVAASMMFDNKISSVYIFDFEGKKYYRDKQVFKNIQMEDIMVQNWYQDLVDLEGGYLFNFNGGGLIDDSEYDYLSFFRIINSNVNHQPVGLMMICIEDRIIKDFFNIDNDGLKNVVIRESVYKTEMVLEDTVTESFRGRFFMEPEQVDMVNLIETIDREMASVSDVLSDQKLYFEERRIDRSDFILTGIRNDDYSWTIAEIRHGRDRTSMIALFNIAIVIIIALNSVVIIYGSYLFSGYITNPITELIRSMKAVEAGTFIPVEVATFHDEIGSLKEGYNYMIIEIQRLIEEVIKEQQVIKDAELRVIMEQIKPHFMYNTLDSINSLLMLGRSDDASNALTALAKFYRSSLSDGRSVVTLRTEIEIIKNYLLIQDIRYHDLFKVVYDVDESVMDLKVPKLMLQPLVENSLYHGIRPMGVDGLIQVSARQEQDKVVIEIADNGMGMADRVIDHVFREAYDKEGDMSSIGLPATIKRITHMFENRSEITIDNKRDGTVIRIELREVIGDQGQ